MQSFTAASLASRLNELSQSPWSVVLETFPHELTMTLDPSLVNTIRMRIPGTPAGGESTIRAPRRLVEKRFGDSLLVRAHQELKQSDPAKCFYSLSHCDNAIVAAASGGAGQGGGAGLHGVGVDLEPLSRRVAMPVLERVSLESERKLGLDALGVWVVKEACFKSHPKNAKTVVSQYILQEFDKARGVGSVVLVPLRPDGRADMAAAPIAPAMKFICANISLQGAEPKWRIALAWS